MLYGVHQVVVVHPVNGDVQKAEHIANEHGQEGQQCGPLGAFRNLEFQHHNGDNDRKNAIAECL